MALMLTLTLTLTLTPLALRSPGLEPPAQVLIFSGSSGEPPAIEQQLTSFIFSWARQRCTGKLEVWYRPARHSRSSSRSRCTASRTLLVPRSRSDTAHGAFARNACHTSSA